jgi:hypothetical protein
LATGESREGERTGGRGDLSAPGTGVRARSWAMHGTTMAISLDRMADHMAVFFAMDCGRFASGCGPCAECSWDIRHSSWGQSPFPKGQSPVPRGSVRSPERVLRHSRPRPSPFPSASFASARRSVASVSRVGPRRGKSSSPFLRGSFARARRAGRQWRKGSLSVGSRSGVGGGWRRLGIAASRGFTPPCRFSARMRTHLAT